MQSPLRAAAYCRVSTDREDQSNSLASQKQYFTDYIRNHADWQLVNIYYDEGISGTQTKKRAGFNSMIHDACEGRIDLILTKEVSRFARNTVDTLSYTRKLKEAGIGVVFTIDNIDTREADGELRLTIMASIAQEESRKTSERVKWGQKRRMEQGVVFGRDLLGYTVKNGTLLINETEVPAVRAIFHKYTNERKGTHIIARELLQEGFLPQQAQNWSGSTILRILKNEKYAGDLCQKKTFTPDYLTHTRKANHDPEDLIYLKDHHQPIIDRDLWNRTQTELRSRSSSAKLPKDPPGLTHAGQPKSRYSSRYWCSGKLFCGECSMRYVSRTKKRSDGSISRSWRCYGAAVHGARKSGLSPNNIGCNNPSINDRALITCVQFCIRLVLGSFFSAGLPTELSALSEGGRDGDSEACRCTETLQKELLQDIQTVRSFSSGTTSGSACIYQLEKEIQHLQDKKRKAADLYLEGHITMDDLKSQCQWYEEKKQILLQKLTAVHQETSLPGRASDPPPFHTSDTEDLISKTITEILDFCQNKPSSSSPVPYTFCSEILKKVILYPDKSLSIWFHSLPFGFHLQIHTYGKLDNFTTDILKAEFLPPEAI